MGFSYLVSGCLAIPLILVSYSPTSFYLLIAAKGAYAVKTKLTNMKKKIILSIVATLLVTFCFSQNCSYKVNELDKFTKKYTKITEAEKVIGTFYTVGMFSVKKVDNEYFFLFDYTLSSYASFDPYSINTGAQLIFLLEDGSVITLKAMDNIKGVNHTYVSLPVVYTCELTNIAYPIKKVDIDKFFTSGIKSIRFYRTESNGKEDYVDNDIRSRLQGRIQDLIKCVL